ncbi:MULTISPECIES: hypothetical protein [unclassified Oleiphilus]|uniref:hypothetical protein n=1 Tax=unclassified Oleiphilus TaxID=2631174 RepID=UPI0007C38FF6|nr:MULTISPECIES: hypothetical protein [unclassified Oleiphilus]KZZ36603.1 hypothetical protein A3757_13430 [Oleiphilus sp. HI0117]KZZ57449.1 hypothetical protein A3761_00525 [Oleiphilus sp. HI0123]
MTTSKKQKDPEILAINSKLKVSGQTVVVQVSQISGIKTRIKPSSQIYLPRHSSLHKILLRPYKADKSQYRLVNHLSPCIQTHLAQLKPDVVIEAFALYSQNEVQDRLDDFVFGELASILPKPLNTKVTRDVIEKMVHSKELLDVVVTGFELEARSPNAFPTKVIAKLLNTAPGTIATIVDEIELAPKWNDYAKLNNYFDYRTMIRTLKKDKQKSKEKNYEKGFIKRLRKLERNSERFVSFAEGFHNTALTITQNLKA